MAILHGKQGLLCDKGISEFGYLKDRSTLTDTEEGKMKNGRLWISASVSETRAVYHCQMRQSSLPSSHPGFRAKQIWRVVFQDL